MTEQSPNFEMTDDEVMEVITLIKKQAKSRIGKYVHCEFLGEKYPHDSEKQKPSNTLLAELYGDSTEFLMDYRPYYSEMFGIDDDRFYIINEHYAAMGYTADDLVDYLDDIFVTEFVERFAELADYPSESAKLSAEQFVYTVFETLEEHQDKFTDDEVISDGLVTVYIRALLLNHAEQLDTLIEQDIKHTIMNVLNIPKDIV